MSCGFSHVDRALQALLSCAQILCVILLSRARSREKHFRCDKLIKTVISRAATPGTVLTLRMRSDIPLVGCVAVTYLLCSDRISPISFLELFSPPRAFACYASACGASAARRVADLDHLGSDKNSRVSILSLSCPSLFVFFHACRIAAKLVYNLLFTRKIRTCTLFTRMIHVRTHGINMCAYS